MTDQHETVALTPSQSPRILALCDSPAVRPGTAPTGFARVGANFFTHWTRAGAIVDIWALHFDGWGYGSVPWTLFPGGNRDWNSPARLSAFLQLLDTGCYTHVWLLSDADALCVGDGERSFPKQLRAVCQKHGIRSLLYFPIDAERQEPEWMEIVQAVDVAVSYTEWGAAVVRRTLGKSLFPLAVLPHGLDAHFLPGTPEQCAAARACLQTDAGKAFAQPDDLLLLAVNKNEWRKDLLRTLEILRGLIDEQVPAKLILRTTPDSRTGGIHIPRAAAQLGLIEGKDFILLDAVPEMHLPSLYHAADLYLTTTLGEGWGLGITEALACGTPVAMPRHSACGEIGQLIETDAERADREACGMGAPVAWLESELGAVCGADTRLRWRVDLRYALEELIHFRRHRVILTERARTYLSWSRIAAEMLALLTAR